METMRDAYPDVVDEARAVQRAASRLAYAESAAKDDALRCIARALRADREAILEANASDVEAQLAAGTAPYFVDRLRLDGERIETMASQIEEIIALEDPVGRLDTMWLRPNGLKVGKQRIPLGVIGIIYEARPNVTSDAAALCLKSGNGVLLKGGSAALASNRAIYHSMRRALSESALPEQAQRAIGFVDSAERDAVRAMLELDDLLDLVIPRGGEGLIRFVHTHSRVPVIKHDQGVCHLVVDGSAPAEEVDAITINAKCQRPSVCNAIETLLLLESAVEPHLDRLLELLTSQGVRLHLDAASMTRARALGLDDTLLAPADDAAYAAEFLALELAVRVVASLDEAIAHIRQYGSRHTESLLTQDYAMSQRFQREVDSSVVVINASTRFADGNQLGLGAEIGISTTRLHAYGPMGLEELTTTNFVVLGAGQVRS